MKGSIDAIWAEIRAKEMEMLEANAVEEPFVVGIFGSIARGEQGQQSDIDLLADILRPISLLELVGAELYLNEILEAKVDLVPKRDVREELREIILREAIAV